ncbi:ABC transporter permease [Gloeothece verrucosa]|uniref:ABC-2 type transporter n=1 Tax=Gloeothece verrucosa (strain PCC 7822) TaxID=497965 RepID=E0UMZ3_GLOV7|nr:ABC transporter permease [Gloeothece verrucosa]ADN18323.1 ABC-2 type transporter [Gloeothece verrucosa PCC 7822]
MSPYFAILSARIRTVLQYRTAAIFGTLTQLFWGLIRVMIFNALYSSNVIEQPMTHSETTDYVWLGQAMFSVSIFSIDNDLLTMMRVGTVCYELLKPVDLYSFWYFRAMASRLAQVLLRTLPIFALALLFFGLKPPASFGAGAAAILALLGALLLTSAISTLASIILLWTIAGQGINQFINILVLIFSGIIVPLPFFPDWFQSILNFLPFRDLVDVPLQLYVGHIPPYELGSAVLHQLAWIVTFVIFGRLIFAFGTRRLVIQGG